MDASGARRGFKPAHVPDVGYGQEEGRDSPAQSEDGHERLEGRRMREIKEDPGEAESADAEEGDESRRRELPERR